MHRGRWFPGVFCAALLGVGALAQERPRALVKMQEARERLVTGEVHYSWERPQQYPGWIVYYTARFAGPDHIDINRGDAAGRVGVRPGAEGVPALLARGVRQTLMARGEFWLHWEREDLFSELWEDAVRPGNIFKLRSLGVTYQSPYDDLHDALWRDGVAQPSARVYRESVQDGLHRVSADTDYGVITWWIDPLRDWSPVRVTFEREGNLHYDTRSTLKQYGAVWYPARVVIFAGSEGKPLEVFEVQRAAFNRPDHPPRLTPTHIGLEVGATVAYHTTRDGAFDSLVWDGERPITSEEFTQRVAAGDLKYGPRVARALSRYMTLDPKLIGADDGAARREGRNAEGPSGEGRSAHAARTGGADAPAARGAADSGAAAEAPATNPASDENLTFESRWERYTREFIEKHRLNEDQQQKAWLVLRQCQARATVYLWSRQSAFERLEKRVASVEELDAAQRLSLQRELLAEREALFAPIEGIFEKQLKPGLDKLLTRAQRREALRADGHEAQDP